MQFSAVMFCCPQCTQVHASCQGCWPSHPKAADVRAAQDMQMKLLVQATSRYRLFSSVGVQRRCTAWSRSQHTVQWLPAQPAQTCLPASWSVYMLQSVVEYKLTAWAQVLMHRLQPVMASGGGTAGALQTSSWSSRHGAICSSSAVAGFSQLQRRHCRSYLLNRTSAWLICWGVSGH